MTNVYWPFAPVSTWRFRSGIWTAATCTCSPRSDVTVPRRIASCAAAGAAAARSTRANTFRHLWSIRALLWWERHNSATSGEALKKDDNCGEAPQGMTAIGRSPIIDGVTCCYTAGARERQDHFRPLLGPVPPPLPPPTLRVAL